MNAPLFAGERLEHPSIERVFVAKPYADELTFRITGTLEKDAAAVIGKLVRIDLLHVKNHQRSLRVILDFLHAHDVAGGAWQHLEGASRLIAGELGAGLLFLNVSEDLYALLKVTRYANAFTVRRVGEVPRTTPELQL